MVVVTMEIFFDRSKLAKTYMSERGLHQMLHGMPHASPKGLSAIARNWWPKIEEWLGMDGLGRRAQYCPRHNHNREGGAKREGGEANTQPDPSPAQAITDPILSMRLKQMKMQSLQTSTGGFCNKQRPNITSTSSYFLFAGSARRAIMKLTRAEEGEGESTRPSSSSSECSATAADDNEHRTLRAHGA